jgi:acetyltransferase-like isoleucine patch superfamily enzyme
MVKDVPDSVVVGRNPASLIIEIEESFAFLL